MQMNVKHIYVVHAGEFAFLTLTLYSTPNPILMAFYQLYVLYHEYLSLLCLASHFRPMLTVLRVGTDERASLPGVV